MLLFCADSECRRICRGLWLRRVPQPSPAHQLRLQLCLWTVSDLQFPRLSYTSGRFGFHLVYCWSSRALFHFFIACILIYNAGMVIAASRIYELSNSLTLLAYPV